MDLEVMIQQGTSKGWKAERHNHGFHVILKRGGSEIHLWPNKHGGVRWWLKGAGKLHFDRVGFLAALDRVDLPLASSTMKKKYEKKTYVKRNFRPQRTQRTDRSLSVRANNTAPWD